MVLVNILTWVSVLTLICGVILTYRPNRPVVQSWANFVAPHTTAPSYVPVGRATTAMGGLGYATVQHLDRRLQDMARSSPIPQRASATGKGHYSTYYRVRHPKHINDGLQSR